MQQNLCETWVKMLARQYSLLIILVLGLSMPTAVYAGHVQQQRPVQCYQCTLDVIIVNVVVGVSSSSSIEQFALAINPSQAPVGTPFTIQFRVVYPAGTNASGLPVTLSPPKASFRFANSSGASYILTGVSVNPVPNQPGNYTYPTTVTSAFPGGAVTVYVLARSLQDAVGNVGPATDVSSAETLTPLDNSVINIGPAQVTPPPATNYAVPAIIVGLLLLALISLLVRSRRKKRS